MTEFLSQRVAHSEWPPVWMQVLLAAGALALGAALARLPLLWTAIGLLAIVLVTLTLIDPLVGVSAALLLGPTKPLTDYFVPQLPLDLGQIALIVTLGAWFVHAARQHAIRVPRSPFTLPLLIFIGAASLSVINALSIGYALKELVKWAQMLVMMWLVIDLGRARGRWRAVVGVILATAAAEALIGVWQFGLRGDGPSTFLILGDRFYRAYGTFEQPNPYAGFMGMTLALAIGLTLAALEVWAVPTWQALKAAGRPVRLRLTLEAAINMGLLRLAGLTLLCLLMFAALIMSWSRGAWLGFGAAAVAILFAWPRKAWIGAALVIGGVVLGALGLRYNLLPGAIASRLTGFTDFLQTFDVRGVDINDANYAVLERLAHWQAAESMVRYHPWLGVGFGNYEPVYPAYRLLNWPQPLGHAHNIYLNLLAETGIIGLVAYIVLWASVFWQTWQATRLAGVWQRSLAVGLFGTWAHLAAHQFVDKLYVANLHLIIGALLGVLSILILTERGSTLLDRTD
jgi:putative inorganic carbon (HCO3(-)) transporter